MSIQMNLLGSESQSQVTAFTMSATKIGVGPITVGFTFGFDGQQFTTINSSNTILGNWINLPTKANEWEVRATLASGITPSSGTLGSWLSLGSLNRAWSITSSSVGTVESNLTFEFRRTSTGVIEKTSTNNILSAEVLDIF